MTGLLRGGGKRGRVASVEEQKQTRALRIDAKKQELFIVLLQLKDLNHPATLHIVDHINQALKQDENVVETSLNYMSIDNLQSIRSEVEETRYEQARLHSLAKFIWNQDLYDITHMSTAMKLAEMASRSITTFKFYENYMDKFGNLSWDNFKDAIDKVLYNEKSAHI